MRSEIVLAHGGQPLAPRDLWSAWNFEPSLLIPLGVTLLIYFWGTRNVWRQAGTGHGITAQHLVRFSSAILALVIALLSPLDVLSGMLFSAHMLQHLILILVAAPLLVMSDLPLALLWALPRRHWAHALATRWNKTQSISRIWQVMSHPIFAWSAYAIVIWIWHAPLLYQAALRNDTIHAFEHLSFLITSMLFWWVLLKRSRPAHLRYAMAIPYLFTTALQSGILGALMIFATQPWYPYYADLVKPWGLTPLQDQQLAGLIMWLPGGTIFTLLTIGYFAAWLRALDLRNAPVQPADSIRIHQEGK